MYGSSLMLVTRILRDSRIAAREAAAMPFPREETTPPVTNTYFVIYPRRVVDLRVRGQGQCTKSAQSMSRKQRRGQGGALGGASAIARGGRLWERVGGVAGAR